MGQCIAWMSESLLTIAEDKIANKIAFNLDRLNEKGLLKDIKLLMIECYDKGPKPLENILLENGFKINKEIAKKLAYKKIRQEVLKIYNKIETEL